MVACTGVADAGFIHLKGIHTLNMTACKQFTDAALVHLGGINALYMSGCTGIAGDTLDKLGCSLNILDIQSTQLSLQSRARDLYGIDEFNQFIGECNIQQALQGGKRKRKTRGKKTKRRTRKLIRH